MGKQQMKVPACRHMMRDDLTVDAGESTICGFCDQDRLRERLAAAEALLRECMDEDGTYLRATVARRVREFLKGGAT